MRNPNNDRQGLSPNKSFDDMWMILETKVDGLYSDLQTSSNITIFPEQQGGDQVKKRYIEIGTLPAIAGTLTVAHGLKINRTFRIFGTADNTTAGSYLPLPFVSSISADIVSLSLDSTNVILTIGKDMSAYSARVCIEFIE